MYPFSEKLASAVLPLVSGRGTIVIVSYLSVHTTDRHPRVLVSGIQRYTEIHKEKTGFPENNDSVDSVMRTVITSDEGRGKQ